MASQIKTYVFSLLLLGVIDFVWIGWLGKDFNNRQLSGLAPMDGGQVSPRKIPAVAAYLVMALALTAFGAPHVFDGSALTSFGWGALLGLSLYGVFDLTNLAIVKNYPLPFALVDMSWGTFLFGATNMAIFFTRDLLG